MANFTSTHTGSVVDAAVTKITATSSSATELNILDGVTATTAELNILDGVTATTAEINILDGVTATAAEINILDGVTSTAAELNILDGVTSTAAELNVLDGYTGSVTELNYLDTLHATGVTSTEFDYLDGVTSNIQTQLDAKIEATLTSEQVQDIVGAMFSSNTESGITVSYEDGDGTIDLTVATQSDNNFTTTLLNKLNAIEASADVTDTANVTSAGALMDSEVSNLSFVKGLTKGISDGNVLTANDAVADNDFLRIDGTEVEGRTAAEVRSDLNVEDGATADQTASEIKTLVGNASDSNVFTDADHSKLDGIEASADVTDATNVTAAGALMDSELTSIADVKALDQSVISGASPTFGTANMTDASNKRFMTDAQETKLDSVESNATADQTDEEIQDVVGAMFSSNTETGITATYQDGDGTIDLVVGTLNQDTTGTAAKVTVSDSTANTNFPVVFHDESNALLDDTGALRYNPSTGELLVPKLTVAGTTTQVDTVTMEAANAIIFEGATADAHETTLSIVDPTADHTQYLINQGGYIPVLAAATTTAITSTPAELNVLDGITSTTAELNILDGVTATAAELNIMDGVTATTAELNYTDGVTSNIQTQLDSKIEATLTTEQVQDIVGGMFSSNTETRISATYEDGDGTIDLVVDDMTANTTYTAGTGLDLSSTEFSVDVSDFMSNGADNRILTATGTDAFRGEGNLTFDGSTLAVTGALTTTSTINIGGVATFQSNLAIESDGILYFGGGSHTFIREVSDDNLTIAVGGTNLLDLVEDSTDYVRVRDNTLLAVGSSNDMNFKHNGTNSFISNGTGALYIDALGQDEDFFIRVNDGGSTITAISIDSSEVGKVRLPNDNQVFSIGAGGDLAMYHNGSNSYIYNANVGDLIIQNNVDDKDIIFRSDDGSGGVTAYLTLDGSAEKIIINKNMRFADSVEAMFGAGEDLEIKHDGSNSYIKNDTGDLYIQNTADDKDIVLQTDDGSGGVENYMQIDGSAGRTLFNKNIRVNDSVEVQVGSSADLRILHDGTDSEIKNYTGGFYITQHLDDGDIILRSDDGSGGVTAYLTLDGSASRVVVGDVDLSIPVAKKLYFGGSDHTYISEDIDDRLRFFTGGAEFMRFTEDSTDQINLYQDTMLTATKKLYLDGGSHTYITESSADRVKIFVGGDELVNIIEGSTNIFRLSDNVQGTFGNADDIKIYHNSSSGNANIENHTGSLYITNYTDDGDIFIRVDDGGSNVITALQIDASETGRVRLPNDNQRLTFGADQDLQLSHESNNNYIATYAGNLILEQNTNDADIIFNCDDGSGGVTAYLTLDGSTTDLLLTPPGNVGIGTSSPSAKLDVVGSGNAGIEVTGGSGYVAGYFGTDFDYVAKFESFDASAAIVLEDSNSTGNYNRIGVATHDMFFVTNNSERMRIDSSGRLVVGATAAVATTGGTGASQVLGTGNSDTIFTLGRFSNNTSPAAINFVKSRNGTIGSNTIVQDGDTLGSIVWAADDGSDFVSHAAKIDARIDGTPGANDTPGRLSFYTTADGSDSAVERVRIDAAGNMRFSDNASNPSASSNMAFIFNDGGEMKVLDELGNTTTISPHNFELIPEGASEDMAWSHHSVKGNKTVNVDMMKLARLVEQLTGEKLVYTEET